uniref:Uncharacterized protein n=1 Tax=Rhizophora mucronata TaxID=61149 RepID=A0A2P2P2E6_RHIMU
MVFCFPFMMSNDFFTDRCKKDISCWRKRKKNSRMKKSHVHFSPKDFS